MGTSRPYVQLQEAIRTANAFGNGSGMTMRPKCFLSNLRGQFGMSATFQCSVRPFESFRIFTRNEWGPADHMCSCKKQSKRPKLLRVAVGCPCASSVSVKCLEGYAFIFECNISMQRAPLKHSEYLQGMNGDQLTICAAARSNQNGQSL